MSVCLCGQCLENSSSHCPWSSYSSSSLLLRGFLTRSFPGTARDSPPPPRCCCADSWRDLSVNVFLRCDLESVARDIGVLIECDSMRCSRRSIKSKDKEIELWQCVWSSWRGQWSFEECDWMCCRSTARTYTEFWQRFFLGYLARLLFRSNFKGRWGFSSSSSPLLISVSLLLLIIPCSLFVCPLSLFLFAVRARNGIKSGKGGF